MKTTRCRGRVEQFCVGRSDPNTLNDQFLCFRLRAGRVSTALSGWRVEAVVFSVFAVQTINETILRKQEKSLGFLMRHL